MKEFRKKYKKLYKVYINKLKKLQKTDKISIENYLEQFIIYLKFLRDYFILTELSLNEDGTVKNHKINTINAAISEYDQYLASCNNIEWLQKHGDDKAEDSLNKYTIEKQIHWNYFWEIVKQNSIFWEVNNATV